jgi:hypothetical protein
MGSSIDLTGKSFGAWTVLGRGEKAGNSPQIAWLCRCECGTERSVVSQPLRTGKSVSCGCKKSGLIAKARTQHGRAGTKAYQVWGDMVRRCTSPKCGNWPNYGGRGIKVCPEWLLFENWNADMGDPPPGMTLERINNDGNYERSNCKWATVAEQNRNQGLQHDLFTGRFSGRDTSRWAPEYRAWLSIIRRCSPGNARMVPLYSARGITVCPEWEGSFDQFLADIGPMPRGGWTVDRIDNDKGYCKENCRWADCQTQAKNRRQNQIRWPRKAA